MNNKTWIHKPIHHMNLSEKKKDWYKACIGTYQIGDWIKAGLDP